jgi:hypothetical protein
MTKEIVTALFLSDLKALLKKYNAEITCADHYQGYPECGEDVRMTVEIPSKYDSGELIQEWTEIDLGHGVDGI